MASNFGANLKNGAILKDFFSELPYNNKLFKEYVPGGVT
jgi:hypothetical protein